MRRRLWTKAPVVASVLAMSFAETPARAQSAGFALDRFDPSPAGSSWLRSTRSIFGAMGAWRSESSGTSRTGLLFSTTRTEVRAASSSATSSSRTSRGVSIVLDRLRLEPRAFRPRSINMVVAERSTVSCIKGPTQPHWATCASMPTYGSLASMATRSPSRWARSCIFRQAVVVPHGRRRRPRRTSPACRWPVWHLRLLGVRRSRVSRPEPIGRDNPGRRREARASRSRWSAPRRQAPAHRRRGLGRADVTDRSAASLSSANSPVEGLSASMG